MEMVYLAFRDCAESWLILPRIFIIEGLATIAFAILSFFVIVDWPEDAKFLTTEEKALIAYRLANDGNSGVARMDSLTNDALKRIFRDWKIWCGYVHRGFILSMDSTDLGIELSFISV